MSGALLKSKVIVTYNGSGIIEFGKITDNMPVSIEIRSISDEPADLTVAVDNNKFGRVNSVYSFDQERAALKFKIKRSASPRGKPKPSLPKSGLCAATTVLYSETCLSLSKAGRETAWAGRCPFSDTAEIYVGGLHNRGNGLTDIALYSFDRLKYTKHSTISANGDRVNDFLFPFFFLDTAAEYVRVDIYSNNMKFISNAAYTSYLHRICIIICSKTTRTRWNIRLRNT